MFWYRSKRVSLASMSNVRRTAADTACNVPLIAASRSRIVAVPLSGAESEMEAPLLSHKARTMLPCRPTIAPAECAGTRSHTVKRGERSLEADRASPCAAGSSVEPEVLGEELDEEEEEGGGGGEGERGEGEPDMRVCAVATSPAVPRRVCGRAIWACGGTGEGESGVMRACEG